ncbi:uncharacterized protein [Miscanthus floridulus]|uniref:uncharacterized protein n=1 Tax=Miscanthus floridulus TaxID=154761 RepID=UPI00345B3C82
MAGSDAGTDATHATEAERQRAARKTARDAALARAAAAEEEAAAAQRERDEADARIRAALQRAAAARKEAPLPSDEEDALEDDDESPALDAHRALLMHEAQTLLHLHAQAVAVQNIRLLVPVVLDSAAGNYARWREQFLLTVGKYSLQDHVLREPPVLPHADWIRMDCVVRSWLYGTIANELVDIVMTRGDKGASARATWVAIETQFLGNKETRTILLNAQFRNFKQGDLSVTDYCKRLKTMADDLADLGTPIDDKLLVLTLVGGLNEKFAAVGRDIRRNRPLRSFLEARDDLLLEEMTLPSSTPPTALHGDTSRAQQPPRPPVPHPPSSGRNNSGGGGKGGGDRRWEDRGRRGGQGRCNKGGHKGDSKGTNSDTSSGASGPKGAGDTPPGAWPSFWNPWTGTIHMYPGPGPARPGVPLRPVAPPPSGPPLPQAHLAQQQAQQQAAWLHAQQQAAWAQAQQQAPYQMAPPPGFSGPPTGLPSSWDQQSLASTFSTMTLNQPQSNDWYLDSGSGISEGDRQVQ